MPKADDPLIVMRRCMRLQEAIARQALDAGNATKATNASLAAAALAQQIALIEEKRGISHEPVISGFQIELIASDKPAHLAAKDDRIAQLEAEVASLQRRLRGADTPTVIDAQAIPGSAATAPASSDRQQLLPAPPVESDEERIKRRRRENGDNVDVGWARAAFTGDGANAYRDRWDTLWQSGDLLTRIK